MSNLKFYTFFGVINLFIILFIVSSFYIMAYLLSESWGPSPYTHIMFFGGIIFHLTNIIIKLLLPKIIIKISNKYKNLLFNKFLQFLYDNPTKKMKILALAFCFDLPWIIHTLLVCGKYSLWDIVFLQILPYFLYYAGGVFLFYLMLYKELKYYKN